jgi:hypothetical protein
MVHVLEIVEWSLKPYGDRPDLSSGITRRELVPCFIMRRETARRLFVLVLSVALATGLIARTVQAAQMDVATATMTADMPMHGKCDGCAGSEKAMPPAACAASFCSMAVVMPVTAVFDPAPAGVLEPATEVSATGHAFPPDPYPPRPSVLS